MLEVEVEVEVCWGPGYWFSVMADNSFSEKWIRGDTAKNKRSLSSWYSACTLPTSYPLGYLVRGIVPSLVGLVSTPTHRLSVMADNSFSEKWIRGDTAKTKGLVRGGCGTGATARGLRGEISLTRHRCPSDCPSPHLWFTCRNTGTWRCCGRGEGPSSGALPTRAHCPSRQGQSQPSA